MIGLETAAMREQDRLTAEAFADPRPGDRFHEMFSWWVVVVSVAADGVKVMHGSGPVNLRRGRFPDGELVEPFPERAEVRWYATAEDFRAAWRYGSIPGYTVTLAGRGLDVAGWLESVTSVPAAPTRPDDEETGTRGGRGDRRGEAVNDSDLPTWGEIEAHALRHLDAARTEMSEVRDWLRSDWRPLGSPLPGAAASARSEVLRIAGEVKNLIDQAKGLLQREEGADRA